MANKIPAQTSPPPKLPKPKVKSLSRKLQLPFLPTASVNEPVPSLTGTHHSQRLCQNLLAATTDVAEPLYQEVEGMSDPITLSKVVEQYSRDLPIVVRVRCSLYGVCDTVSLVEGELLNLHFLKETECVRVSVSSQREFSVPIASAVQFSPLYDPSENLEIAKQGSTFDSVEELMLAKPLPPVVCVTEPCGDTNTLVAIGDILVPKTVKKRGFGDGNLLCYGIIKGEEVLLNGKWKIKFSTNPDLCKLYLSQFLHHIKLPQKAAVTFSDEHQQKALGCVFRHQLCTLLSMHTELSLIVTFTRRDMDRTLIEIPSTFAIQLSVQRLSTIAKRQLVDETDDIREKFEQKMVGAYISTEEQSQANLHLHMFVHKPVAWSMKKPVISKPEEFADPLNSTGLTDDYYDYVTFTPGPAKQAPKAASKEMQDNLTSKAHSGHSAVVSNFMKRHVKLRWRNTNTLTHMMESTTDDSAISATESDSTPELVATIADPLEVNKKFLSSLDCEQVSKVLDRMNLGVHKKKFKSEEITGDLMLELDDGILEQELGVVSRLHRIKLLKVITGQYSVQPFLDKQ